MRECCKSGSAGGALGIHNQRLYPDIKFFREAENGRIERMMNFVVDPEKAGIAVILIHHTKKEGGTYKGTMEIEALSQPHVLG